MPNLIVSARTGDRSAREELHRQFSKSLARFLRSQVGKKLERTVSISDLSQESFLRSFDAIEHLPEDASRGDFEAMLFRNARWVVGSHARKHDRFAGESADDQEGLGAGAQRGADRSAGSITRQDELRWFGEQIERLKPDQALVLRLRQQGLEFDEIASRLDLSEHAVRKRFLRAAVELRRLSKTHLDS